MSYHLYLTLIPEALIASMLNPEEFAAIYAIGEQDKPNGQLVFIEIDPDFRNDYFEIDQGIARCVPTSDGLPKDSIYISIYRVLEHIPIKAMGDMYYLTRDGHALRTAKVPVKNNSNGLHLYYELAPVRPTVVSPLGPVDFADLMTGNRQCFPSLPAIAFVELELGELATDPDAGNADNLPYDNIEHLRFCLKEAQIKTFKSKIFNLSSSGIFLYRVVKNGIFIGNQKEGLSLYALPSIEELNNKYYDWWRSANT